MIFLSQLPSVVSSHLLADSTLPSMGNQFCLPDTVLILLPVHPSLPGHTYEIIPHHESEQNRGPTAWYMWGVNGRCPTAFLLPNPYFHQKRKATMPSSKMVCQ